MKTTPILTLLAAAGLAIALPAAAQAPVGADTIRPAPADTFHLPGVVVTATRVPMPVEALPTPVTVITGVELRERGLRTVADALRTVPAAAVVQVGPPGGQTSLFLRGGQSGYVKVLVDGVPVNEPGGAIDLADLTTDQVDRIEVVRGPVSVLYGSDAVTGVVQVFTRRGAGAPRVRVRTAGGFGERRHDDARYGALDVGATVSGSVGALAYMVGGGRSWNDGAYPFNSDRRIDALNSRLDWSPRPGTDLAATLRFSDSDTGLPTDGAGDLVDLNARLERQAVTLGLEAGHRLAERVVARVQLGVMDRDQLATDEPDGPADTLGVFAYRFRRTVRRVDLDGRLDMDLLPGTIASIGATMGDQRGGSSYASESEWGPFEADAAYQRRNSGYYAQLLSEPVAGVHLTAGGRFDRNEVFGNFPTHRLGLTWDAGTVRIRGALGRSFREPTFAESFGSGFGDTGNPDLVPERSRSWEAGIDTRPLGPVRLGATWFDQRFTNMIQYTFATDDPADPNYYNVGAARARGLEVTGDLAIGRLGLLASHTWLDTRVLDPGLATDAGFVEGEPLLRRPAHASAISARLRHGAGALGLTLGRVGEREDMDFGAGFPAQRVTLPAHTTLDLAAEHRLPLATDAGWDLVLRVENALDARYESTRGFPAPGRLVTLGVRLTR